MDIDDIDPTTIRVQLHTGAPSEDGWTWPAAATASETITHFSIWDAPADRPRRFIGRSLIWLGGKLTAMGTRSSRLVATGRRDPDTGDYKVEESW